LKIVSNNMKSLEIAEQEAEIYFFLTSLLLAFSALMLLVERQGGLPACKN